MSNTNYDVELNITYDDTHKHYIPTYRVAFPYNAYITSSGLGGYTDAFYQAFVSFDEESEEELQYFW